LLDKEPEEPAAGSVEIFLSAADALTWDYAWWNASAPWPIVPFGYLHFFLVASWVHDMAPLKQKVVTLCLIYGVVVACLVGFGGVLGWI
jgi:hypothetical protein